MNNTWNVGEVFENIYLRDILLALCEKEDWRLVYEIENLNLAIEWVKSGLDLHKFYLLERNDCDVDLAFEMSKILKII